ncbi:uncharacterized protein LOC121281175 isoform X3 [Carcharodon carcharias]|uniref:uncharacterized protein LOC121281175 isoform X3 n=1 Tax=Carcharodon carcharias TaxID=13397 RepID=UPI001B7DFC12|nr:uncharacterized protein LOC121281175 isoform X3 [Carcharodon carcharias]
MSLRFFCSNLPAGSIFSFFVFLLPPVFTQSNTNHIYFLDKRAYISLKGPDNPGDGPVVWKWKPHSGQEIQQLVTFWRDRSGRWNAEWSRQFRTSKLYRWIIKDQYTINLRIDNPGIQFAGLFTLTQAQPRNEILKHYEIFGIKVETDSQRPVMGSDITLSCTISRLSDTVSLHWKQRGSSQQNRRKTDQIRLNNTAYLMVKCVTVEDEKLYECEVKENGSNVITGNADFLVSQYLYGKSYTLYRSSTDHSELNLICYSYYEYNIAAWSWRSHHLQNQEKEIASASKHQPIRIAFGNRLVPRTTTFNGNSFNMSIVPVLFEDAGVYTCSLGSRKVVTMTLITVKVTAEPSDAVTEGDTVTLTCSVSDVTETMRLVWIDSDGKAVVEKTLNGWNREEKSLKLIILKAERGSGKWFCVLLHDNKPQVSAPYYLEPSGSWNDIYFFHQGGNFVLKGPDNPGNGSIVLEWRPHSGQQTTKQLGTFHREGQRWAVQWSGEHNNIPDISQGIREDWGTLNLRMRNPTFELAGLFTWSQTQPSKKILKQYEVFGIKDLHEKKYTLYRSSTDHSEIDLICEALSKFSKTEWTWSSRYFQNQEKEIASAYKSQPIGVKRTYFGNRLVPTKTDFNGKNFIVRIVPVLFDDAGVYTCLLAKYEIVTITLITVKVTSEPSDAVTEGDTVTLTCSVSDVTESMRIVWINRDGKTVVEKTLKEEKQEQGLLQLVIQNANRDRRNWTCVLFHQNIPQVLIPHYLKVNNAHTFQHTSVVIFASLAFLLLIILAVVLRLKCKAAGLESQRPKSLQPKENTEDASQLYSSLHEIQQMQGDNETAVPETSGFDEYAVISRKAEKDNTEREDIHYGSIDFQKKATGSSQGKGGAQWNTQSSDTELASSKEDVSSVIYAQGKRLNL